MGRSLTGRAGGAKMGSGSPIRGCPPQLPWLPAFPSPTRPPAAGHRVCV